MRGSSSGFARIADKSVRVPLLADKSVRVPEHLTPAAAFDPAGLSHAVLRSAVKYPPVKVRVTPLDHRLLDLDHVPPARKQIQLQTLAIPLTRFLTFTLFHLFHFSTFPSPISTLTQLAQNL
jgi:hypothetical protein